jgi:hypothetical protein
LWRGGAERLLLSRFLDCRFAPLAAKIGSVVTIVPLPRVRSVSFQRESSNLSGIVQVRDLTSGEIDLGFISKPACVGASTVTRAGWSGSQATVGP